MPCRCENLQTIATYFPGLRRCWEPKSGQKPRSPWRIGEAPSRPSLRPGEGLEVSAGRAARPERSRLSGGCRRASAEKPCLAARRARRVGRHKPRRVLGVPRPAAAHLCSPARAVRRRRAKEECSGETPRLRGPSGRPEEIRRQARRLLEWQPGREVSNPFPNTKVGRRERERRGRGGVRSGARVCVCARGCACVCARVFRGRGGALQLSYLSKRSRTMKMQKARGKAR